ncbi:MAG: Secretion system C-terminal sorting domain [Bacteroidota bacterium]|jgi:hypothetical protein
MKKLFVIACFSLTYVMSWAQSCTPGANFVDSTYGVWPDTTQNFPAAVQDVAYSTDLNFKVPATVTAELDPTGQFVGSPIQQFTVTGVTGLPTGFNYACNISNCTYSGGSNGCANVYGTTSLTGTFPITIEVTATVLVTLFPGLPPTPVTQPVSFPGYKIVVGGAGTIEQIIAPFQLTPNPASSTLTLSGLHTNAENQICVTDLSGKVLYKSTSNAAAHQIDVNHLINGVYLVQVMNQDGISSVKFMKQ